MFQIIEPQTAVELEQYYHFRWQQLHQPMQRPRGYEQDAYDAHAHHLMIRGENGEILAVGRVYMTGESEAQIRHIAVLESKRQQGLGTVLVNALEEVARNQGAVRIVTNARINAIAFFERCGYQATTKTPHRMDGISQVLMVKNLPPDHAIVRHENWCQQIQQLWQQQIPISEKMGITLHAYNGYRLELRMSEAANTNLHGNMFTGSQYSLGALAGWGMLHLALSEHKLSGDIVMVKGEINYLLPLHRAPRAVVTLEDIDGDFAPLGKQQAIHVHIKVKIYEAKQLAATFSGHYKVLPE